ncbi:MAG: aminotransferase class I/II-fold pyridoxal phosphate-dependent enzyme, partial [Candidatus Omnitrophica bacterium]|nr:aminotransferase class I/II-fold pyridoxal phosphate-dependent enzyme [Candidatus Omnitrophota bacterium]
MGLFSGAKPWLSRVKNYEPGKPLEELEREYGIRDAVKMASNENALGPSPKALKAATKALFTVHRYPEGGCYVLRQRLAKHLSVSPESLVFGNGSDEILVFAIRAFVGSDDEIVIADPTFLIYEIACQAENGRAVKVPMKNFRYDLDGMLGRITGRTKVIFIANPDNPIGTAIAKGALEAFLKKVPSNVVVVLDEAYYEFAKSQKDYPDSLNFLKTYKNLLVTRTFSKAYGLSGLRVGYGIASPEIVAALNKVREPF